MKPKIEKWSQEDRTGAAAQFLARPAFDEEARATARQILAEVKKSGDKAVAKYTREFDGAALRPEQFAVTKAELAQARDAVAREVKNAIREVHRRIGAFSKASLKKEWLISSPRGGLLGEQFAPLDRVGIYIPGGAAPLVSTAIMTATPARVAGVPHIVACTPCDAEGKVNPALLHALETAGATEIYRLGGVQAIGAMAYGTETIAKVQKIVGPGGTYVTAAKREVYGDVALDMVAGPSEIAVLADDTAPAAYVAADLLSQAEHGTGWEKALLATPSHRFAEAVAAEVEKQAAALSRRECVEKVIEHGMLLAVTNTLDDAMDLCNRFAPEHLEIMVREPKNWLKKVHCAGAVFVGTCSPEVAGDYVAGPSHVLPTGGTAAMFSGLTADDFRKRTSVIAFTRADLHDAMPVIEIFGKLEGMDGHVQSAKIRFDKP